jgi:hypothetical protein
LDPANGSNAEQRKHQHGHSEREMPNQTLAQGDVEPADEARVDEPEKHRYEGDHSQVE